MKTRDVTEQENRRADHDGTQPSALFQSDTALLLKSAVMDTSCGHELNRGIDIWDDTKKVRNLVEEGEEYK